MNKTRIMIVLLFVLAFASGLAVSLVFTHPHHHASMPNPSWLTAELGLSSQQKEEMIKIWGNLGRPNGTDEGDRRRTMSRQRDEAIRQLVPADKQKEFDQILENHNRQMTELFEQRRKAFDAAVEKTKAILTPEQRTKYEEILAKRMDGRHGRSRTSTQPATQPTASEPATRPQSSDSR